MHRPRRDVPEEKHSKYASFWDTEEALQPDQCPQSCSGHGVCVQVSASTALPHFWRQIADAVSVS